MEEIKNMADVIDERIDQAIMEVESRSDEETEALTQKIGPILRLHPQLAHFINCERMSILLNAEDVEAYVEYTRIYDELHYKDLRQMYLKGMKDGIMLMEKLK